MEYKYIFKILSFLYIGLSFYSCKPSTDPKTYMDKVAISKFKYDIARYVCQLPKFATEATKFSSQFDAAYFENSQNTHLDKIYFTDKDTVYFEVRKLAPSIKKKYHATGGRLVKNKNNELIYYEEIYRTWKMDEKLLAKRTAIFFNKMIQHEDLSSYYTHNINDDTYIEFPNKNCIFDIGTRKWVLSSHLAYR